MAYREPGVYLEVQNTARTGPLIPGEVSMIPLVIGTGASKLRETVAIVRAESGDTDIFPFTSVASIAYIGSSKRGIISEWIPFEEGADPDPDTGNYTFVADSNEITWNSGGPEAGSTYYVTLVYNVEDSQFEPKLCRTIADVTSLFGPEVQENESGYPLSPVSLGARIVLEQGAPTVYVLQVNYDGEVTVADYIAAIETHARFIKDMWRVVIMDNTKDIQDAVIAHITEMSSVEERMERCAILGKAYTDLDPEGTVFSDVLTKVGGLSEFIYNRRVSVMYPDKATRLLGDGTLRELDAPYLACAIAGAQWANPPQRSLTRVTLNGFNELKGVKMIRTQMNQLAEKGVMILTQENSTSPITIRHQLSTDMSTLQFKENSILAIEDYCAKLLRNACEVYIGRYNITPELISMVKGTLDSTMDTLKSRGVIVDGRIDLIMQDENNPDTIIVSLSVLPPYPCNYIEITLILE